jgi:hypothetical protein
MTFASLGLCTRILFGPPSTPRVSISERYPSAAPVSSGHREFRRSGQRLAYRAFRVSLPSVDWWRILQRRCPPCRHGTPECAARNPWTSTGLCVGIEGVFTSVLTRPRSLGLWRSWRRSAPLCRCYLGKKPSASRIPSARGFPDWPDKVFARALFRGSTSARQSIRALLDCRRV